jgi:hypothetical protein
MEPDKLNKESNAREDWINELRNKYLDGSLDNILIPDNPKLDQLLEDLFPEPTQATVEKTGSDNER